MTLELPLRRRTRCASCDRRRMCWSVEVTDAEPLGAGEIPLCDECLFDLAQLLEP